MYLASPLVHERQVDAGLKLHQGGLVRVVIAAVDDESVNPELMGRLKTRRPYICIHGLGNPWLPLFF